MQSVVGCDPGTEEQTDMVPSDIFAITLPNQSSADIAIAACRAGAIGTFDLVWKDQSAAVEIERLARLAKNPFGLRLSSSLPDWQLEAIASHKSQIACVIVSGDLTKSVLRSLRDAIGDQTRVLAEITGNQQLEHAASLPVDGVVLKGNESGGYVASETTFLLLQRWNRLEHSVRASLPAYPQGGIGLRTASACIVAGASGIVLDSQLALANRSTLPASTSAWVRSYDGSQTHLFGESFGKGFRIAAPPGVAVVRLLRDAEMKLQLDSEGAALDAVGQAWTSIVESIFLQATDERTLVAGQDLALASELADKHVDVAGIIDAIARTASENVIAASESRLLDADSPLAASNGTGLPIVQGPMTRVSDTAEFAESIAREGGLPLLALALMRGTEASAILAATREKLGDRGWGAGLLGFLPPEIRNEQVAAIKKHRPPIALIAGGRPDQAKELEEIGIPTYLHAPSPGLLEMFLRDGARRFVFEGRECGGHVGPRSSFVLWDSLLSVLESYAEGNRKSVTDLHLLFAGGIHDGLSAAMATSIAGRLARLGAKVGVLMGSAYLFTKEAVSAGAIVPRFQEEALKVDETVLLETGPGHAIRCIRTPYRDLFDRERRRLVSEGKTPDEITRELEWMNIGRLRVASKGLERGSTKEGGKSKLESVSGDKQYERGMYMVGQVAALRSEATTVGKLHDEVCKEGARILDQAAAKANIQTDGGFTSPENAPPPCDVAIVGMSAMYPGAIGLEAYWQNILDKHYAVTEVPRDSHWDWELFYDPDPRAPDKIISKWGGFLSDVPFDPFDFGITPRSIESIEPLQLLLLESMKKTLADAGYDKREFNRDSACAVLGIGGGGSPVGVMYGIRSSLPIVETAPNLPTTGDAIYQAVKDHLPEWTEDSFPGILMNVAVGRVANRFNLGGSNYALDAACASSLAAVHACIRELQLGTTDVAFAMGADTVQTPYAFMAFSKTHALSPKGRCRPFDADADGIVLSEGLGIVMLKRLDDAERDGDKIYGVIRGIGSSSDGKDKGLTAPNASGQLRALRRAYENARIEPSTIGLVEAHGTGTVVGDRTEATSVAAILEESGARQQSVAIGSVKSMIGHSKCAAGVAGLIKATMALHTKTLPPTLVETPSPVIDFPNTGLYLNTETRPWINGESHPRRAGVSAFGFGGTNVHLVVEEYSDEFSAEENAALGQWPAELFVWKATESSKLKADLTKIRDWIARGAAPALPNLAASLAEAFDKINDACCVAAIVAKDLGQLKSHLDYAIDSIDTDRKPVSDPRGIYLASFDVRADNKVAMLFPGQGAQYPDMLSDLLLAFPQARSVVDQAAKAYAEIFDGCFAQLVYPPSAFTDQEREAHRKTLAETSVAQPALAAFEWAAMQVIDSLGITADFVGGHSFGEFVALTAAGSLSFEELLSLAAIRGRTMREASQPNDNGEFSGAMAAVGADAAATVKELSSASLANKISIANDNSPSQTVISGKSEDIAIAVEKLTAAGMRTVKLDVSCAFHSPLVEAASSKFATDIEAFTFVKPKTTVFSNTTAQPHESSPEQMLATLKQHLASPVRFREQIEAMYASGARTFVEVGPGSALTGLVGQTLGDRPHSSVSIDRRGRDGLTQLVHMVASLITAGVPLKAKALFEPRDPETINLRKLDPSHGQPNYRKSVWMVNGMRNRPLDAPEKHYLGQRNAKSKTGRDPTEQSAQPSPPQTPASSVKQSSQTPQQRLPVSNASEPKSKTMQEPKTPINRLPAQPSSFATPAQTACEDEATAVMLGYQQLMRQFLQTQRDVMLAYLDGDVPEPVPVDTAPTHQIAPSGQQVAPTPAYEQAPSANGGNGHATSNVAVPINKPAEPPAVAEKKVAAEPPAPSPAGNQIASIEQAEQSLLELVSDRTGYPVDMLDLDADLEGDLGIDSIKRVEILGNLAEVLDLGGGEEDLQDNLELEKLTTIRTLRGIVDYLGETIFSDEAKKKVKS